MEIKIEILRKKRNDENAFVQTFLYTYTEKDENVATALRKMNADEHLKDINGQDADEIKWECNCLQKKCGACAMVINGRPRLACAVRLSDEKDVIRLEPLKKFPVIEDLIVDRNILFDDLKEMKAWFEDDANTFDRSMPVAYEASRCLQCGCCLEVCPNFYAGGKFFGMAGAVPVTRLLSKLPDVQKKEATRLYRKHVFDGCGKSLACRNICPAKIDIDAMLINSNAIAVWKKYINK